MHIRVFPFRKIAQISIPNIHNGFMSDICSVFFSREYLAGFFFLLLTFVLFFWCFFIGVFFFVVSFCLFVFLLVFFPPVPPASTVGGTSRPSNPGRRWLPAQMGLQQIYVYLRFYISFSLPLHSHRFAGFSFCTVSPLFLQFPTVFTRAPPLNDPRWLGWIFVPLFRSDWPRKKFCLFKKCFKSFSPHFSCRYLSPAFIASLIQSINFLRAHFSNHSPFSPPLPQPAVAAAGSGPASRRSTPLSAAGRPCTATSAPPLLFCFRVWCH